MLEYVSNNEEEIVHKNKVMQHVKFTNENYKTGAFSGAIVELSRPVKLFLVNSRITDTGGLKPYRYLKDLYGRHNSVKMVTGSDRDTPAFFSNQNSPINRVETNSRANNVNPSK